MHRVDTHATFAPDLLCICGVESFGSLRSSGAEFRRLVSGQLSSRLLPSSQSEKSAKGENAERIIRSLCNSSQACWKNLLKDADDYVQIKLLPAFYTMLQRVCYNGCLTFRRSLELAAAERATALNNMIDRERANVL